MKRILSHFTKKKTDGTKHDVFPPKNFVDIMEKSVNSKRISIFELHPSQRAFHMDHNPAEVHSNPTKVIVNNNTPLAFHNEPMQSHKADGLIKTNVKSVCNWIGENTPITIRDITINGGQFYLGDPGANKLAIDQGLPIIGNRNKEPTFLIDIDKANYSDLTPELRYTYLQWLSSERNKIKLPKVLCYVHALGIEKRFLELNSTHHADLESTRPIYKDLIPVLNSTRDDNEASVHFRLLAWIISKINSDNIELLKQHPTGITGTEDIIWSSKVALSKLPMDVVNALKWYTINRNKRDYISLDNESNIHNWLLSSIHNIASSKKPFVIDFDSPFLYVDYIPMSCELSAQSIKTQFKDFRYNRDLFERISDMVSNYNISLSAILANEGTSIENLDIAVITHYKGDNYKTNPHYTKLEELLEIFKDETQAHTCHISDLHKSVFDFPLDKSDKVRVIAFTDCLRSFGMKFIGDIYPSTEKIKTNGCSAFISNKNKLSESDQTNFELISFAIRAAMYLTRKIDKIPYATKAATVNKFLEPLRSKGFDKELIMRSNLIFHHFRNNEVLLNTGGFINKEDDIKKINATRELVFSICSKASTYEEADMSVAIAYFKKSGLSDQSIKSFIKKVKQTINPILEPDFTLNKENIKQITDETGKAKKLLTDIFDPDVAINSASSNHKTSIAIEEVVVATNDSYGLDKKHYQLFRALNNNINGINVDIINLCSELELLPSGAVETINDWAFSLINAPIIEDDFTVDEELFNELLGELND